MSDDLKTRIEELIRNSRVMLFPKGSKQFPACGFSERRGADPQEEEVSFETFNILADPEVRQGLKGSTRTGRRSRSSAAGAESSSAAVTSSPRCTRTASSRRNSSKN